MLRGAHLSMADHVRHDVVGSSSSLIHRVEYSNCLDGPQRAHLSMANHACRDVVGSSSIDIYHAGELAFPWQVMHAVTWWAPPQRSQECMCSSSRELLGYVHADFESGKVSREIGSYWTLTDLIWIDAVPHVGIVLTASQEPDVCLLSGIGSLPALAHAPGASLLIS